MSGPASGASVWLFSDDLIFARRIAAAVVPHSVPFHRIGEADLDRLPMHRGLLILDLDKGIDLLGRAISHARLADPDEWHVCGYGAHIDAAGLLALRRAGADRVTSRSQLLRDLQSIIRESISR